MGCRRRPRHRIDILLASCERACIPRVGLHDETNGVDNFQHNWSGFTDCTRPKPLYRNFDFDGSINKYVIHDCTIRLNPLGGHFRGVSKRNGFDGVVVIGSATTRCCFYRRCNHQSKGLEEHQDDKSIGSHSAHIHQHCEPTGLSIRRWPSFGPDAKIRFQGSLWFIAWIKSTDYSIIMRWRRSRLHPISRQIRFGFKEAEVKTI